MDVLQKLKKRKRMENFQLQSLREVVKKNGPDMMKNFEENLRKSEWKEKGKLLKIL